MAEPAQPEKERPRLMAKRPEMIVRARITEVEARKNKDIPVSGIELRLEFDDVLATGRFLEAWFSYLAIYQPDAGLIRMKGLLMVEMGEKRARQYADEWATNRQMDQRLAQTLLSNVNYKCGSEAIFVGKLLDLPSPLVPPPIALGAQAAPPEAAAQQKQRPPQPAQAPPGAARQPQPAAPKPHTAQPPITPYAPQPPTVTPPAAQEPSSSPPAAGAKPYSYISPFTGKKTQ